MLYKVLGGLLASFSLSFSAFCYSSLLPANNVESLALNKEIYNHPTWEALVHVVGLKSAIDDKSFILSHDNFSLKNELIKTIRVLVGDQEVACRFPARRRFILSSLSLTSENLPEPNCEDYLTFKKKAPAREVSLVYASENLSQPSSMMGHVMLKMTGENDLGLQVEHGVSFFTNLDSFNVPKIIWDSLVMGKKGYFQVSPFQASLDYYLYEEQRNVWEYRLNFSQAQTELFQDHLWELKNTDLKYFFNSYNCATVTQMLLRVGDAQNIKVDNSWLSPIDVVKSISQTGSISQASVSPSSKWKIRMLSKTLDSSTVNKVATFVDDGNFKLEIDGQNTVESYLTAELAQAYNDFNVQSGEYTLDKWKGVNEDIKQYRVGKNDTYQLDLSDFKSPLKTPGDSQFSVGFRSLTDNKEWWNIKYLPASHAIEDDNSQFFSENELKLMEFSILINRETQETKIDSWTLYSARSNVPWDALTGGISGHFELGLEQHWNDQLESNLSSNFYGGAGYTYSLSRDISVFSMLNAGVGASSKGGYLYAEPEIGLYLYEIYNMKTFLSYKNIYNQQKSKYRQQLVSLTHSFLALNDWSIYVEFEKRWNKFDSVDQFGLHLKYQY